MNLETRERQKYRKVWADCPFYGKESPGLVLSGFFFLYFRSQIKPNDTVIDFGCGSAKVSKEFLAKGLNVHLVDIAENCLDEDVHALTIITPERLKFTTACLWNLPSDFPKNDWIYCCDVLEHIPEEKVDQTLHEMAKRTIKGGFLQIFLKEERFGDYVKEDLHLTIKDQKWWREKLEKYWDVRCIIPIIENVRIACFVGAPK